MNLFLSKLILVLTLVFCTLVSHSQKRNLDSLRQLLKNSKQDTVKVKLLINISAELLHEKKLLEMIPLCEMAKALSIKLKFYKGAAKASNYLGSAYSMLGNDSLEEINFENEFTYYTMVNDLRGIAGSLHNRASKFTSIGNYKRAFELYNKALQINIEIGNKNWEAYNYSGMASIYETTGEYPKALVTYFKALKIVEEVNDKSAMASMYGSIAGIFRIQNDNIKSLEYYNKQLKLSIEQNDDYDIAGAYSGLSITYQEMDSLDKSEICAMKALKIYELMGSKDGVSSIFNYLGNVYRDREEYTKALQFYNQSLAADPNDPESKMITYGSISATFIGMKKYNDALTNAFKCLDVARQLQSSKDIQGCYELLVMIYEKKNEGMKALEYYKKWNVLKDSIFNEANTRKVLQSEINFEYDKKTALAKVEQEKKDFFASAEKQKQNIVLKSVCVVLIIVFLLALLIFRGLRISQKQKIIIQNQKTEVENQKHLVEEKQKEVLDSIRYAKRIQTAHLPNEKFIAKSLERLRKI